MKNRGIQNSQVREILKDHGLTGDIPPEIRSEISSSMDKGYRSIMKKTGGLTVAASISGLLFFLLRRIETWLPAAKVVIPVSLISTVSAAVLVTQSLMSPKTEPVLLLRSFQSATVQDKMVRKTGQLILESINGQPEGMRVDLYSAGTAAGDLPLIVGSMERAGKRIFITVKIIDPVSSKILFITEASAEGVKELHKASEKLAAQIHTFGASLPEKIKKK